MPTPKDSAPENDLQFYLEKAAIECELLHRIHAWAGREPDCAGLIRSLAQAARLVAPAKPVPMTLTCPKCGMVHVDEGEWATRPHKTHQCQDCFNEWKPFEYATVGVAPAKVGEEREWIKKAATAIQTRQSSHANVICCCVHCESSIAEILARHAPAREPANAYPKPCGICDGVIQSKVDLDWHGYGNCREIPDAILEACNSEAVQLVRDVQGHVAGEVGERIDTFLEKIASGKLAPAREVWIDVKERLPKYDTDILLWGEMWDRVHVGYWRHSHEWIGRSRPESDDHLPDSNPTHWRYFAEPPARHAVSREPELE